MHYLGVCAILKEDPAFIDEWLAFHILLGVEAFYLYDNGNRPPLTKSLEKFSALHSPPKVMVYNSPGKQMQLPAYQHQLQTNKECRWLAFIDADEFLLPARHDNIPAMLEEFEPYAGLALNWKTFGSNGHKLRPAGLQIENYTRALPPGHSRHTLVKSIINPAKEGFFFNPHICLFKKPEDITVTEKHVSIITPEHDAPTWEKAQINHYYYRSKQDFSLKMQSLRADTATLRGGELATLETGEDEDTAALRFAPGVKALLGSLG